jgi:hypothetical protein
MFHIVLIIVLSESLQFYHKTCAIFDEAQVFGY